LAFRIDGIPKFFLEAKALKVDLDVSRWAEQAIICPERASKEKRTGDLLHPDLCR
jgi:hypothetical protein